MNTPHQNYNYHDTHCDYISVSCTEWGETKRKLNFVLVLIC